MTPERKRQILIERYEFPHSTLTYRRVNTPAQDAQVRRMVEAADDPCLRSADDEAAVNERKDQP